MNNLVITQRIRITTGYIGLLLRIFLTVLIVAALHGFITAFRNDVATAVDQGRRLNMLRQQDCARRYRDNHCDHGYPDTDFAEKCKSWKLCMERTNEGGSIRIKMQVFAEVLDAFLGAVSYRSIIALISLFVCTTFGIYLILKDDFKTPEYEEEQTTNEIISYSSVQTPFIRTPVHTIIQTPLGYNN
eukprot:TRINITY_DN368_c0_g1_i1.p1 TRINITY_DN368_c0_g1~~TRINITY_DN368_c0_g1_i1.p1  ORF type:complete len:199 (-),score=26.65 TRINITY_DN368_c0_g1_i1:4-564(-)